MNFRSLLVFLCVFGPLQSAFASDQALEQLFPNSKDRQAFEDLLQPLWQHQQRHCAGCHAHPIGAGWEAYQIGSFSQWKSAVVARLGFQVPQTDGNNLYRILANDYELYPESLRMPPNVEVVPTDVAGLKKTTDPEQIDQGLGTQPLYISPEGACVEKSSAPDSLCTFFTGLNTFVQERMGGYENWQELVEKARYDLEHHIHTPFYLVRTMGEGQAGRSVSVYLLPEDQTISFYTRIAPDESAIAFTKTSIPAFQYRPVVMDLKSGDIEKLDEIAYDPTFSPDYDLDKKIGFMFGAKSGRTEYAKSISFYLPGQFEQAKRKLSFTNISGYESVALLQDRNKLPEVWKPFVGKYVIMGKRWRWFILDTEKNSRGEVVDFKVVYPERPERAANPLCPQLSSSDFDRADSMLSPGGQYISLKKNPNKVPVIVRTKDCAVLNTPALSALYGGKASFSNDEAYMTFHAFGSDGTEFWADQMANKDLIKKIANQGLVSNVFVYQLGTDQLRKITANTSDSPAINFFPNFNGSGSKIYYHRHIKRQPSSEILVAPNPF